MSETPAAPKTRSTKFHVLKQHPQPADFASGVTDAISAPRIWEVVAENLLASSRRGAVESYTQAHKDETDLGGTYRAMLSRDWPVEDFPVTATQQVVIAIGGGA